MDNTYVYKPIMRTAVFNKLGSGADFLAYFRAPIGF
jgi:hypothetical protein